MYCLYAAINPTIIATMGIAIIFPSFDERKARRYEALVSRLPHLPQKLAFVLTATNLHFGQAGFSTLLSPQPPLSFISKEPAGASGSVSSRRILRT